MKKVEIKDVKPYDAAGHFNMSCHATQRQRGNREPRSSGWAFPISFRWGGAEMAGSPTEKVYFVLEGEITIVTPKSRRSL